MQNYTQECRKGALVLGMTLYTQEILLKYIGGLHNYLRHMILMFNADNLDEVCVQATHMRGRGRIQNINFPRNLSNQMETSLKVREKVNTQLL